MIPGFHSYDLVIGLVAFLGANVFWMWMLVDSITNKRLEQDRRILWVLIIIFTHLIGAFLYFFFGRQKNSGPLPQLGSAEEVGRYYVARGEQDNLRDDNVQQRM